MQRSTIIILRIVYWILNVAIVGALIYMAVVGAFFLRKMNFSNFFGDLVHMSPAIRMIFGGLFIKVLYAAGIIYILVLVSRIIHRFSKEVLFDRRNLRQMQRIAYLLLLSPAPVLVYLLCSLPMKFAVISSLGFIINFWPYCLGGVVLLVAAELYRKGLDYKQDVDLTV